MDLRKTHSMACCKTTFKLKNSTSELDTLCRNLENFGNTLGLTKKCLFQINLALDELFTNIISYGYRDNAEHWVKIAISHENGTVVIRIEDTGMPFNPDAAEDPDTIHDIEKCPVGGLGIHLIKKLMDEILYERCGDKNVLTLKKNITAP